MRKTGQEGFTLMEGLAAGFILVIVSAILAKGFGISGELVGKSVEVKQYQESIAARAEKEENPDGLKEDETLRFSVMGEGGEVKASASITADKKTYGEEAHLVLQSIQKSIPLENEPVQVKEAETVYDRSSSLLEELNRDYAGDVRQLAAALYSGGKYEEYAVRYPQIAPREYFGKKFSDDDVDGQKLYLRMLALLYYYKDDDSYLDFPAFEGEDPEEICKEYCLPVRKGLSYSDQIFSGGNEYLCIKPYIFPDGSILTYASSNNYSHTEVFAVYDHVEKKWYRAPKYSGNGPDGLKEYKIELSSPFAIWISKSEAVWSSNSYCEYTDKRNNYYQLGSVKITNADELISYITGRNPVYEEYQPIHWKLMESVSN